MRQIGAPASRPAPLPFGAGSRPRSRAAASLAVALLLGAVVGAPGCRTTGDRPTPPAGSDTMNNSIADVIARHAPELMKIPGVVGVYEGETRGRRVIRIMVAKKTPELAARLPKTLEGHPVEIEETGVIRPMNEGR